MPAKKKVKYIVLHDFSDLQDNKKVYTVGDSFPRPANKKVEQSRLDELLSGANGQGRAVIKIAD